MDTIERSILDDRIDWHIIDFSNTLPATHHTFTLPNVSEWADQSSFSLETAHYISEGVRQSIPNRICPFRVPGDGNCLLHCIALAIWGRFKASSEDQKIISLLRHYLWKELEENVQFYKNAPSKFSEDEIDYDQILSSAKAPNAFLEFMHIFALSNIIKRPIIVYASDEDMLNYGVQEHGVSATFLPTRHGAEACCGAPLALAWSESTRNHFVPLICVTSDEMGFEWPAIPPVAYSKTVRPSESYYDYVKRGMTNNIIAAIKEQEDKKVCLQIKNEKPEEEQTFDTVLFFVVHGTTSQHLQQVGVHYNEPYRTSAIRMFMSMERDLSTTEIDSVEKIIRKCTEDIKDNPHKTITKKYKPLHKSRYVTSKFPLIPIPDKETYIIYSNAPYDKILQKILSTNTTLTSIEPTLAINSDQVSILQKMVEQLLVNNNSTPDFNLSISNDALEVISQLLNWEGEEAYPVIHLASIVILYKSVANYFLSIHENNLSIYSTLIGKIVNCTRTLPFSLRIVTFKFFANMFHQEALQVLLKSIKISIIHQIELCLSEEILTYDKKSEEIVLKHIATILHNFAIYWKDVKRDYDPPTLHAIALAKVLNILHTILDRYHNYNDIILKVLTVHGTLIQVEGDIEASQTIFYIKPYVTHPDPKIMSCAEYIVILLRSPLLII